MVPPESRPRVFDRYQVVGPFLIGMCRSPELVAKKGKARPTVLVDVLSFPTEARVGFGGIKLALKDAKGKRYPLELTTAPNENFITNKVYAFIPAELEKQKMDLCGSFEGDVYLDPKDFVVPITKRHVRRFDDFGGMSVKAVSKKPPAVECSLDWNLNLKAEDAKIFKKFVDAERNGTLTPEDAVKAIKWLKSKRAEIRLLHIVDYAALDKNKKVVQEVYSARYGDRLELRFPKGEQPIELRLRLADHKQVTAVFEFKNVFGK